MTLSTGSTLVKQYYLSIRINAEGYTLSVFDDSSMLLSTKKVTKSMYALSTDEIIALMNEETQLNYRTVRLICESDSYTFIPAPVFKIEEAADLFHFQFKQVKTDQIILNRIPKWDTVNIFSIPKTVYNALTKVFPDAIIEHHLSYFLSEYVKPLTESCVYIELRGCVMDVVVITKGAIQLINSYSYNTPEDFTYYTLNLFDKLSLDTENCNVVLFNGEKNTELQKMLELYLEVINGEK